MCGRGGWGPLLIVSIHRSISQSCTLRVCEHALCVVNVAMYCIVVSVVPVSGIASREIEREWGGGGGGVIILDHAWSKD